LVLKQLKLYQFKNFDELLITLNHNFNLIVGQNGMGKTNLLDAVYYLSFCRSNYQHQDGNVVSFTKDAFRIEGYYVNQVNKELSVVAKIQKGRSKKIAVNSKDYKKLSDHIGLIPLIMITPDDIQSLKEGSEERRKLIDACISQYSKAYLTALVKYNRVLKQRNAYLKSLLDKSMIDHTLMDSLDEQLLAPAQLIHTSRLSFLDKFNPIFEEIYQHLAKGHEVMHCKIRSHMESHSLQQLLKENREKDIILQRTSVGPHKDDLKIYMNDRMMKTFASQGQIKSGILSIKLAQYRLLSELNEEKPILLLDDIFDKLDRSRVEFLLDYIIGNQFGQTFVTDTHPTRVSELLEKLNQDFSKFTVEDGVVEKESILKDVLGEFTQSGKIKSGYKQLVVRKFWEKQMGVTINNYTEKIYVRKDTLYVTLSSSPLKQELDLGKEKILKLIAEEFGDQYITQLILR